MIKKRDISKPTQVDVDAFINGATEQAHEGLDPKAARKFKTHTIPMNEYEYNLLIELAEQYGQTHNGIIRFALKKLKENNH